MQESFSVELITVLLKQIYPHAKYRLVFITVASDTYVSAKLPANGVVFVIVVDCIDLFSSLFTVNTCRSFPKYATFKENVQ